MTIPGEMARVTGLPRPDAGRGNRALVAEGYATTPALGVYRLAAPPRPEHDDSGRRRDKAPEGTDSDVHSGAPVAE